MSIFEVNETTTLYDMLPKLNKEYCAIINNHNYDIRIYAILDLSDECIYKLMTKFAYTQYRVVSLKHVNPNRFGKSNITIQKKIKKLIQKEINKELENAYR